MEETYASKPSTATATTPPRWLSLGIAFGVLSAISIALYGPIGVSGAYSRVIGKAMKAVVPDYAAANAYVARFGDLATTENLEVVGLLIGGFLAAWLSGTRRPAVEMAHAGEHTVGRRYWDAFIGGFLLLFGARLAGGCTSGHILSGITQLAMSGFVFAIVVFVTGVATARYMKRRATP